jgi:glutathione synthase/RimK-type ligase-like ATP-grasp enzyme
MRPDVLILSNLYDFSTDAVCLQLDRKGVKYLRLNREQFPDCRMTLVPQDSTMTVRRSDRTYHVGEDLKAVWFRQPVFLRNTPSDPLPVSAQLERSQWAAFLRSLSVFDRAAWMNFPANTYLAESKPFQLYAASQCGFAIPSTLASNDAQEVHGHFPDSAIIKSLDTVLLREGEDCLFTYTTVNKTSEITDSSAHSAPFLAQELLEEKTDIRVTLVGDSLFATKILSKGRGIEGDWRILPRDVLEYEEVELPADVHRSCHAVAKSLGLSFAAIDLIETPTNTYFIEVNPTGEWGWLNDATRPIADAIASWLVNPPAQMER